MEICIFCAPPPPPPAGKKSNKPPYPHSPQLVGQKSLPRTPKTDIPDLVFFSFLFLFFFFFLGGGGRGGVRFIELHPSNWGGGGGGDYQFVTSQWKGLCSKEICRQLWSRLDFLFSLFWFTIKIVENYITIVRRFPRTAKAIEAGIAPNIMF